MTVVSVLKEPYISSGIKDTVTTLTPQEEINTATNIMMANLFMKYYYYYII